ncbi:MAG: hypothetical protein ACM31L_06415 [Actinomycetota bacterium]
MFKHQEPHYRITEGQEALLVVLFLVGVAVVQFSVAWLIIA